MNNPTNELRPIEKTRILFRLIRCISFAVLISCLSHSSGIAEDKRQQYKLHHNEELGYLFETGQIKGSIQPEGNYHGINQFALKQTGWNVVDPRYSALNLFKLMARNQYMGAPRLMDRKISVENGAVAVTWPATEIHLATLAARYEVSGTNSVDVTVTVSSKTAYPDYEVFIPSYFDKSLRPYIYLQKARYPKAPPELVVPLVSDVFRGTLLAFPRDVHAARLAIDGRWDRKESKANVVPVTPARNYAHCMAFLVDDKKTFAVVVMARPKDCYAITARYFADDPKDRMTSYSAVDFCMFGNDLLPGQTRTARLRLAITPLDEQMSQPMQLYKKFLASFEKP